MFTKHITIIEFETRAAGVADGENPAAFASRTQAKHKGRRTDVIDHHIHAAPLGELKNFLAPIVLRTINQYIGTESLGLLEFGCVGTHDVNETTGILGDLDGG